MDEMLGWVMSDRNIEYKTYYLTLLYQTMSTLACWNNLLAIPNTKTAQIVSCKAASVLPALNQGVWYVNWIRCTTIKQISNVMSVPAV